MDSTGRPFLFRITKVGREFLLQEGTDQRYGARHLKRAIERHVVSPLARLLGTAQVQSGDVLLIDRRPGEQGLAFRKDKNRRSFREQLPFVMAMPTQLAVAQLGA